MSRLPNITLTQLEYLLALDEYRHFIKAAESCFVTQPTLSMQIKKLEEELDVKLFDRGKQPVIPTDVGKMLIEQAKKVIREVQRIENSLQTYKGDVNGDLTVGVIPTVAPYLMPHLISRISKAYPGIKLHVKELMTDDIVQLLKKDHLDVGIVATPLQIEGLEERPIFYEKFCFYLNPSHFAYEKDFLDLGDITSDKLWLLSEGNCFRHQTINLCALNELGNSTDFFDYESGSIDTLIKIVNMEGGATVIPEWAALELTPLERLRLRKLKEMDEVREISLVYTRNFAKANLLDSFYKVLEKCVPDALLENKTKEVISVF